ncbi:unnamed protein product [Litomosoides sigmodontis]|uniref:Uncharacterized protein n=1 Tax=Litomosoides sigmodontis TaxID=42156 RepID=A0A3P6TJH3_LITSI|nr:unnamed protein product [Litomosoides sigmodontis]
MSSVRKDNAEEVAKRRAAIQQEIEQRQKLARKLQDEKMARAIAQKEEHLLKQRKVQQREMLRAKAVLDRRTQVLAEKEKEKKEALLAKVHALASRFTTQHKSRPVYAFGSSTPRELEYLTQLTREQKIYDRKLVHSDRSTASASGASSHATLSPPHESHNYAGTSMTGSLYVAQSDLKASHKRTSNCMTQSVMITPRPSKTAKNNRISVNRQSMVHRPMTATKTAPSTVDEVTVRTKKLVQQNVSPLCEQRRGTVQSKSSEMKTGALKAKFAPVLRKVRKSAGLKTNDEVNEEVVLEKLPGGQMSEAFMIMEESSDKIQVDIAPTEVKNAIYVKEVVNLVPDTNDTNETKKFGGGCAVVEVSDESGEVETADCTSEDAGSNDDDVMKEKITHESALEYITETAAKFTALDISSEKNNSINEKGENAAPVTMVNMVVDQEARMRQKQEKENNVLKEAEAELQDLIKPSRTDQDDSLAVYPNSFHGKGEKEGNLKNTVKVLKENESLVINERLPEIEGDDKQEEVVIQKRCEIAKDKKENNVSAFEVNKKFAKGEIESSTQNNSTLRVDGIKTVTEDLKLVGEKYSTEEKRRIQDELLAREQREREIRKAKLASIMSRTRGSASSLSVVPPVLHIGNSEIETSKHGVGVPLSNEYTPVKSVLSHTTASVLQKLATTNPKLLSVLQRNGSKQSLAVELSVADPSMSITLPGQPVANHEGSSTIRHLPFEPDVNHRPVAMK